MELICPFADQSLKMKSKGHYPFNYPTGAVIHFTAGKSIKSSISYGVTQGYGFWGIDRSGELYQTMPLNEWGAHAGQSRWNDQVNVSRYFLGIEIASAGRLTVCDDGSYRTWWGDEIPKDRVRVGLAKENCVEGVYEAYTDAQEATLIKLICWLKRNHPLTFNLDNVVGHDEIAPGRKQDPGWSLSMTMPEFRELITKRQHLGAV